MLRSIGFDAFGPAARVLAVVLSASLVVPTAVAGGKPKTPKPAPGSRITGRIVASDGKTPVRGATIEVRPMNGGAPVRSKPVDSKGRYSLSGLPFGWAEIVVVTDGGVFLGDQAVNLPPGKTVEIGFSLLSHSERPESWWAERKIETPPGLAGTTVAGLADGSQRLTGIDYWKSPGGIAIMAAIGVVAIGLIAAGGGSYKSN